MQWLAAADLDPELNPDPDRFDITRATIRRQLVGRGGRWFWLGAGFARRPVAGYWRHRSPSPRNRPKLNR